MSINTNRSSPTQINTSTNNYVMAPKQVSSNWTQISVGPSHTLAIATDGTLYAWGYNNVGQIGNSSLINQSSPVQIATGSWTHVHADINYSIALRDDDLLFGWGYNQYGQLGTNIPVGSYRSSPVQVNSTSWSTVSSGTNHTVAIKSDNTLWAWGYNNKGQLGNTSYINTSSPIQIGTSSYSQVGAGSNYTTALTTNNKIVTFGDNTYGQLGYTPSSDIQSWTMIAGNDEYTLAINDSGLLFGWGVNTTGQLGLSDTIYRSSPTQIGTNSWTFVSVNSGTGGAAPAAIRSDGTLWGWGSNITGEIGDGTTVNKSSPVQVSIGGSWTSVSAGKSHKLAITSTGLLYGWGLGTRGELGQNNVQRRSNPVQILTSSFVSIGTAAFASYGVTNIGQLFAWGAGNFGKLGLGDTVDRSTPVQVGSSSWALVYATADNSVYAIKSNNKLYAWGYNYGVRGTLGTNDTLSRSSPIQIHSGDWKTTVNSIAGISVGNTFGIQSDGSLWAWGLATLLLASDFATPTFTYSWTQISSGNSHTVAIRSDGRLFAWGLNITGQLGDNTTLSRSSPVQIGTSNNEGEFWYNVSAKGNRTVAIRCDNTLWVWGLNSGYVGLNDSINRSSPAQITTAPVTSYTQISAGIDHTLVLNDVGQLYIWGNNNAYQLGFNDGVMRSSPVQLSGSFTQISAGNSHSLVVDSNSKLYAWGDNTVGQIGNNSLLNKSWVNIYATIVDVASTVFGIFSDGSLYSWGTDINGTFGTSTTPSTTRSVPVQIGSSSWSMVAGGRYHVLAIDSVGRLFAWGSNTSGEAGDAYPIGTYSSSPVQLGTDSWSLITAGQGYSAGIKTNGLLYTWGSGSDGVLGFNNAVNRSSPTQLGTDSWSQVSAGTGNVNNLMALRSDYSLFAWGTGTNGQLGIGLTTSRSSPVQVQSGFKFKSVASGFGASFAIRDDYTLWSWGVNTVGILGLNIANTVFRSSPVQIGVETYKQISVGSSNVAAVRTDGSLLVWGLGQYGQIGNNTTNNRSSPVQVGTLLYDWVSSAGLTIFTSLANTKLPNLYAWGKVIDNGTGVNRSSPVQVFSSSTSQFVSSPTQIGSSSWSSVSAGASYSLGVNSVGSLYAWGDNTFGQLGVIQSATAVTTPNSVGAGYIRTIDNNLLLWGYGAAGQIGDLTVTSKSTPVNVTQLSGVKFKDFAQVKSSVSGYTLAISTDNKLWAWGANNNGALGTNNLIFRSNPVQISASSWTSVAVGLNFSIALKSDNTLWGWGAGYPAAGAVSWQSVSAGASHTLILRSDKQLFGFGSNTAGQLGDLTVVAKSSPTVLHAGSLYNSITAGVNISVGIREDNTLWTWGINTNGALGLNDTINRSSPVQVGTDINWSSVSAAEHVLALKSTGELYTWGTNAQGQLGQSNVVARSSPVQVSGSWTNVSAGYSYSTGIDSTSELFTWGVNTNGQLGQSDTINRSSPVQVGLSSWTQIDAGAAHVLGITSTGSLYAWGFNSTLQLGLNDTVARSSPVQVGTDSWSLIAAGQSHSVGITINGTLWTWGANNVGQLGLSNTVNRSSPTQVGTSSYAQISAGGSQTVALTNDQPWQNLYAWGAGTLGLIGINATTNRSSPVQVGSTWLSAVRSSPSQISSSSDWSIISTADQAAYAIKSNGTLWTWGIGANGRLGLNDTISRSSPTQIGSSSWTSVAGGRSFVAGITTDGTLYTWGQNNNGQLGQGDTLDRSTPTQIAGSYTYVSSGESHVVAIKSDGTTWAWGFGTSGQLGVLDLITRSSPVQVSTAVAFSTVTAGSVTSYGAKDNILYGWGGGTLGQLGDGAATNKSSPIVITSIWYNNDFAQSSPTQVGSDFSWSIVAAGGSTSMALESTGELFTWGSNSVGQIGDTTTISRSSIVQIGTSSFNIIAAGGVNSYAIKPTTNLLFGWGNGGTVGDNTSVAKSSPVQVFTATNLNPVIPTELTSFLGSSYTQVQAGSSVVTVTSSNGLLFTWGTGTLGQLGTQNINAVTSSPLLVGGQVQTFNASPAQLSSNSYTQISAGYRHALAIKDDNTLYGWGNFAATAPITNAYSWKKVAAGQNHFVAIRGDNTLWAWGLNTQGQLGTSDTVNRSIPVQIGTNTYSDIAAGASFTTAITTDYSLYAWGQNNTGQLGQGGTDTIARSSPVQLGSSSVNGPTAYSTSFNGTSQYLTTSAQSSATYFGTGSFTIECWVYLTSTPAINDAIVSQVSDWQWSWNTIAGVGFNYMTTSSKTTDVNTGPLSLNTWYHLALVRDASTTTTKVFVNGVNTGTNLTTDTTDYTATTGIKIGSNRSTNAFFPGYISNLRIVKGTAVYTSSFTPSTSPLTAISGTILLTCQNKTFIDNSNTFDITTSSPSPTPGQLISPFVGYSVLFNGSSQYLTVASNAAFSFGTGDFTVEAWIYVVGASDTQFQNIVQTRDGTNNGFVLQYDITNKLVMFVSDTSISVSSASNSVTDLTWNHVSIARNGTSLKLFLNGIQVATQTTSENLTASGPVYISRRWASDGALHYFNGYISNLRIVKGTALYTAAFTPSIYNLPVVSGTSLLTCNSSSIIDYSTNSFTITNNGTATVSQIENPITYNASSITFNGTSQFLTVAAGAPGSGNYTIECWIYTSDYYNATAYAGIFDSRASGSDAGGISLYFKRSGANLIYRVAGTDLILAPSANIQLNGWNHVAIVRNSGTTTMYINGTSAGSASNSTNHTNTSFWIGKTFDPYYFSGYITNFRMVYGSAVYTGNFTVPTDPLTAITNTVLLTCQNPIIVDNSINAFTITATGSPVEAEATYTPFTTYLGSSSSYLSVKAGMSHVIALASDNTLYVWGSNTNGQLGTNNRNTLYQPTQITPTVSYINITAGANHAGAIDTTQNLYLWGLNAGGQLGQSNVVARSSPIQVGALKWSTVLAVGIGTTYDFTMALQTDGTLWSWGYNSIGQLGINLVGSRSSPVQVGSDYWSSIYDGSNVQAGAVLAEKSDGLLFAWGLNSNGQLGLGDTLNRSSPVQLSTSFKFANSGAYSTDVGVFFDTTGQIYTAGNDAVPSGELGDGSRIARSSPVQIASYYPTSPVQISTASWTQVSAGNDLSLGVRTNNSLYAWGLNTNYQTGIGTGQAIVSSPVQIGTIISSASAGTTAGGYIKNE